MNENTNPRWHDFVDNELVEFFKKYDLEKLTADDGNGNKVKLSITKDNDIKVEQSSVTLRN
ncbi:MAG: hypothetical protein FWD82_07980 [Defluviitaleaceae bacterium]|nr:hypothetical protein [Defluviitaleaceae bacterium]